MDSIFIDLTGDNDSITESIEKMNLSPIAPPIKTEMNSINSFSDLNFSISSIDTSSTNTTQPPPFPLLSMPKLEEKSSTPLSSSSSSSYLFQPTTKPTNNRPSPSLQQSNTPPQTFQSRYRSVNHPPPTHTHNIPPPKHNNNRKRRLDIENDQEDYGLLAKRRRTNDYQINMEGLG
eukprot:285215_1